MEIKAGKHYATRGGEVAIINDVAHNNSQYPVNGNIGSADLNWTREGRYYFNEKDQEESDYDLVGPYAAIPAPFVMDARATMAMHCLAAMIGNDGKDDRTRGARGVVVLAGYAVEYADALISELQKGKTE